MPRSYCPKCKNSIAWWQNVPVISYIWLQGKCSNCASSINWHYPIVELISSIMSVLLLTHFAISLKAVMALFLTWGLIAAVFIDLKEQLLPDQLTLPLIWLGLLINSVGVFTSPSAAIIGASIAYLFLWSVNRVFRMLRKIDGMGYGDFKLFAVFGAWFGWQPLPYIILFSATMAAMVGILMVVFKKHNFSQPLPFGPYLAGAGWLTLWWF